VRVPDNKGVPFYAEDHCLKDKFIIEKGLQKMSCTPAKIWFFLKTVWRDIHIR
jgi:hypothetical protein